VHKETFARLEVDRSELELGRQLGKGAFGVVHVATIGGTDVAVKTLSSGGAEMQRKFLIEARLLSALAHPHVVRILHVCTRTMPYAIAVELMSSDLKTYLVQSPREYAEVVLVDVCVQVAEAMEHLARHRVIHRDLAARNVLVSGMGLTCVKLSDMGMARTLSSSPYYRKKSNDAVLYLMCHWIRLIRDAGAGQVDGAREHSGAQVQHEERRVVVWCAVLGGVQQGSQTISRVHKRSRCCYDFHRSTTREASTLSRTSVSGLAL
jgi:serine/threonine protein kinase